MINNQQSIINNQKNLKILLIGGHFTPALAVLDEFLSRGIEKKDIVWVGHKFTMLGDKNSSAEFEEVTNREIRFINLVTGKLYRTLSWKSIVSFLRIPWGFIRALGIVLKEKPDIVMSFGGYISVPIAFWAKLFGISVFTHEQTVTVGRANLFIQKLATKVFLSWQQPYNLLTDEQKSSGKFIVTGNPVRKEVFEKRTNKFDFNNGKKTIYITGGNQGSHIINEVILQILPELLQRYNVIHQCGSNSVYNDIETLEKFRKTLPEVLRDSYIVQTGFWEDEIGAVFSNSNVIVSRSGANSITEILALKKTCVLIPIPWTAGDEQSKNAKLVEDVGLAVVLEQKDLNEKSLFVAIAKCFEINIVAQNGSTGSPQVLVPLQKRAEKRIVDEVLKDTNLTIL